VRRTNGLNRGHGEIIRDLLYVVKYQ
jgi:hypothetical protein